METSEEISELGTATRVLFVVEERESEGFVKQLLKVK